VFAHLLFSQQPVEVWEGTLKVNGFGKEELIFGFAEGDQLILNFEEANGKELKELEILEWPGASRFMEYKTSKVVDKRIMVSKTGVYQLRLSNSALGGRICRVKISRIPASELTRNFNTAVEWKTLYDTSYTTVNEKYLSSRDTAVVNREFVVKVNSTTNASGPKRAADFDLPVGTVSWSYYIDVDQQGQQAYKQAEQKLAEAGTPLALRIPGYGPLAALALQGISYFTQLQKGEDIMYYIVDGQNVTLASQNQPFRCFRQNKVINDFSPMSAPLTGKFYFFFVNDNMMTGVDVSVKICAIVVKEQWAERQVQKMNIQQRQMPVVRE
jgi:hypothetical protein